MTPPITEAEVAEKTGPLEALQAAWDGVPSLPPLDFTPEEAADLVARIRNEALEEAAKVADRLGAAWDPHERATAYRATAAAIRTLKGPEA